MTELDKNDVDIIVNDVDEDENDNKISLAFDKNENLVKLETNIEFEKHIRCLIKYFSKIAADKCSFTSSADAIEHILSGFFVENAYMYMLRIECFENMPIDLDGSINMFRYNASVLANIDDEWVIKIITDIGEQRKAQETDPE